MLSPPGVVCVDYKLTHSVSLRHHFARRQKRITLYTVNMPDPSIFTKIVRGEIPSHKVYEDDKTLAFLNIYPSVPGHVLVVPKVQVDHLDDLDEETYLAVMTTVRKVMKRIKEVLGTERACVKVAGFDVPHAHVHVVGCNTTADFFARDNHDQEPDHTALAAMAERLKF